MQTHSFILPSGVACEGTAFTGKQQRILTEQGSKKFGEQLNEALASMLTRVGDVSNITPEFVKKMLAADRKKALAELRQFSMDFDRWFLFNYEYVDANDEKQVLPMQIDLYKGEIVDNKTENEEEEQPVDKFPFPVTPYAKQYKTYDEIYANRTISITLNKSGKNVIWDLLDGSGEELAIKTPKSQRSSHTAITARNPREIIKARSEKTDIPLKLDLDSLPLKDIEQLRMSIKENEGRVDTELMFRHPEAESKPAHEKDVKVDLLNVLAFFFPSEEI